MADRDITLWLDERWYDALERHIKGETLQDKLENYLDELCNNLLPDYEYEQISKEIYEERIAQVEQREANRCFAVFHVTERGEQSYFLVDEPIEFVNAARSMRTYVRSDDPAVGFRNYYAAAQEITPEKFKQYVVERMEDTGRVVGAFDIDFDSGVFSALKCDDGWHTFTIRDVSTASYHADRKSLISTAERTARLLDYLDGRELTPWQEHPQAGKLLRGERRLRSEDISFADEVSEMSGKLNFYMESFGGIDEVFGTHVCTTETDDYVNVYADYDMERGEVADALTVILHCGDGSDVEYEYPLTAEEKALLLPKMEAYCQQRDGMTLSEYRDRNLTEQRQEQSGSPSMTMGQS